MGSAPEETLSHTVLFYIYTLLIHFHLLPSSCSFDFTHNTSARPQAISVSTYMFSCSLMYVVVPFTYHYSLQTHGHCL